MVTISTEHFHILLYHFYYFQFFNINFFLTLSQNLAIKLLRLFCLFLLGAISSIEHKLSNYKWHTELAVCFFCFGYVNTACVMYLFTLVKFTYKSSVLNLFFIHWFDTNLYKQLLVFVSLYFTHNSITYTHMLVVIK